MTPTEQAASVLADVPRHADSQGYEPEYILETDALAAIACHLAAGDDLVATVTDAADDWQECLGHVVTALGGKPDWHGAELQKIAELREAAARISALTATVGDAREQRSDAEARMETAETETATLRDRLARLEKTYWLLRSFATHADSCKLNKPPKFEGPCSCGLAKALIDGESLAALTDGGKHE